MKTISELDKSEKAILLKAIVAGEVDRAELTPETLFCTKKSDAFLSLMVCATNEETTVICLTDEAKKGMTDLQNLMQ